jgi:hypothetical protein
MVGQHQRRGTVGANQRWQKEIVLHWEGLSQKSQNYCTTGESKTELKNVPTIIVRRELHKSNMHGTAAIAKPLITESNAQLYKQWCHDHKTWTSDNRERTRVMFRWVVRPSRCSLHQEEFTFGEQSRKPTIQNVWLQQWNTVVCDDLGSNIVVQYSAGPVITLHGRITAREYVDRLGNQVHPMIQTLFPNNDAVFQDDSLPRSHSWNCSLMIWRAWRWTSAKPPDLNTTEPLWSVLETRVKNRFPSTSWKQLERVLQEERYKIPLETAKNL